MNTIMHHIGIFFALAPRRGDKSNSKIVEWLRLRQEKSGNSINYKFWHKDKNSVANHCDELETKISDIEPLRRLLSALNFIPRIVVDKVRRSWVYNDWEVSIDSVKNLGTFVELEYKGRMRKPDPDKITQEMREFIANLRLGRVEENQRGYPYMLLYN
ncbi:MAG: class IV adenylate cyclase [Candidatus Vogelbacteria bacterium]|nr:class IV adenylate cyclase [Candidatus Vogelbacteria bacterium]